MLFMSAPAWAQDYPQGYFRSPLDLPILLAGNFGECRSNHFHSGLDIKTEGRENVPVHAAADGYVARIKMQNGGFGHALYIKHPNGYTTLYAHLNDFAPEIQKYMKEEQYKRKSWTVDLYLPASKFPVKKGDIIAYSGNTGSSTAPHLHFEIRDNRNEHPVNPLLFGFRVKDNIPPRPERVAIYDRSQSVYEQNVLMRSLKKTGSKYITDTVVVDEHLVGIGVNVNDYMNESTNTLNFYTASLYMDGAIQCRIVLDDIGYDVTRYLHAYADHKIKKETGNWVQQFFLLPGNHLKHLYHELNKNNGALNIEDGAPHLVNIQMTDALGNRSDVEFWVRYSGKQKEYPECDQLFEVNTANTFAHPNVRFTLDNKDLYDNVCFTFSEKPDMNAYSERYQVHKASIPVHTYFSLYIKPNKPVPFELRNKIALVYNDGEDEDGKAATYDNGWYRASVRNFGEYRLVADTKPPEIIPMQSREALRHSKRITFRAKEDITSVEEFTALLDGEWIAFEQTGDIFYYTIDEHCKKGEHELQVTATDENGNSETIKYSFTR